MSRLCGRKDLRRAGALGAADDGEGGAEHEAVDGEELAALGIGVRRWAGRNSGAGEATSAVSLFIDIPAVGDAG